MLELWEIMGTIIGYIVIGLLGGAIAKAIMPGEQGGGWFKTMLLGIVGALVGGFLGGAILGVSYGAIFSIRGLIFSVLGALLVLVRVRAGQQEEGLITFAVRTAPGHWSAPLAYLGAAVPQQSAGPW